MLVPKSVWAHVFCFSTSTNSTSSNNPWIFLGGLTPTLLSVICLVHSQYELTPDLAQPEQTVAFSWPELILEWFHPSQPASIRAIPQLLFQWLTRQTLFSVWLESDNDSSLVSEVAKVGVERSKIHGNFKSVNRGVPKSALILYFLVISANKLLSFHSKL